MVENTENQTAAPGRAHQAAKYKPTYQLDVASSLANAIVARLKPYCSRIEVAGSIRRKKSRVHDIDIVLIPSDPWNLLQEVNRLAWPNIKSRSGSKITSFTYNGIPVDLYFADEKSWVTLFLIRTGSAEFNIWLCSLAKRKGWKLHADGGGLYDDRGCRYAAESEEAIMNALGLRYFPPQYREKAKGAAIGED